MKSRLNYYPIIRREFTNMEELGSLINRSDSYCRQRMNGKNEFTHREKIIIANYLGRADQLDLLFNKNG